MAWPSLSIIYFCTCMPYLHMLTCWSTQGVWIVWIIWIIWICMDCIYPTSNCHVHTHTCTRPCATLGPLHHCSVPNHLPGSNPAPRLRHSDDHVLHTTHASYPWLCWWLAAGGIGIGSSPASEANLRISLRRHLHSMGTEQPPPPIPPPFPQNSSPNPPGNNKQRKTSMTDSFSRASLVQLRVSG